MGIFPLSRSRAGLTGPCRLAREDCIAPGPRGWPLIGSLLEFRRDVLGLMLESRRRYGDVVRCRLGPQVVHLVARPEHIEHVLLTNQRNYNKETRSSSKIR
ncbi:MAG: cytochrome P450, partial [Deltaproteobacteria bacterium]